MGKLFQCSGLPPGTYRGMIQQHLRESLQNAVSAGVSMLPIIHENFAVSLLQAVSLKPRSG